RPASGDPAADGVRCGGSSRRRKPTGPEGEGGGSMRCSILFDLACMLALTAAAEAQVLTGNIIGSGRDESGAGFPGTTVTLTSPTALPGRTLTQATNEQGEYRFTQLRPGTFSLEATLSGFNTYKEEGLIVAVGGTTERKIVLKLGSLSETITVSGESPM